MLNSATTYNETVTPTPTKVRFDWMTYLNRFGKLYALSFVSLLK
ncbi:MULTISPECIES: hypothetical protein [Pseudoalteromonas]|uniref:Uncharacterized protein n=1 Tax=Pseudoalteromonas aurantia 208 TaxID=1314867 RepID=A0ABR9E6U4_9GAMM|nr:MULTISPECIES: hypothetical protein [Pseudoalteromonas]MBE0366699.1 hypothetical protein [Pseudoalteromonas aurantia 208]